MKVIRVKIKSLLANPANIRVHDERSIEAIKASLKAYGQQKPVVVNRKNIVIAGNGVLEAARQLGWKEIDIHRTTLKGVEEIAYGIADNRTAELSSFDEPALTRLLTALKSKKGAGLESLGYAEIELQKLMEKYGDGVANLDSGDIDESIASKVIMIKCPKCGHEFPK